MTRVLFLSLIWSLVMLSGCATTSSSTQGSVAYLETAKTNFEQGEKARADFIYEEAIAFYEHVRTKYPYTQYAALSDLRIADVYFAQGKWLDAAGAYEFFARFHPTSDQIGYAYFQIAQSNYKAIPSDIFLFPPSYSKDQTPTQDALLAINRYLDQFPKGEFVAEATKLKQDLEEKMANHDMDVATFYEARSKDRGALMRFEKIAKRYPHSTHAPLALLKAGEISLEMGDATGQSETFFERIIKEYPNSSEAQMAQAHLTQLKSSQSTAK